MVSALVRYSIDSNTNMIEAEEIIQEVAQLLVEAITGKWKKIHLFFISTNNTMPIIIVM